ncbi:STING domain-containing protein [Methanosarcina vacuolata]|nr:STING domain-containing protein [Methanosarcina vacuolata]
MNEKHIKLLEWLAHDVVEKILENNNFEVFTPDVPEFGNIMHHIIRSCDRAQLVIADVTGNNPNVLYEMAIIDAMGRPCVPVKIRDVADNEKDLQLFDRAQYRHFEINARETEEAINKLGPVIHKVLQARQDGDLIENPMTDYFGIPLNSMSSAYGIARSYYRNLVVPCFEGKIIDGPDFALEEESQIIDRKMVCIIPGNLEQATRREIDFLVKRRSFVPVKLNAYGREITIYLLSDEILQNADPVIVDIPTTLASLRESVLSRLGRNANPKPNSPDYQEIQSDEILQFKRYLERFAYNDLGTHSSNILRNFKTFNIKDIKDLKATEIKNLFENN